MLTKAQMREFDNLVVKLQQEGFAPGEDLGEPRTPWAVAEWVAGQPVSASVRDAVAHTFIHHEGCAGTRLNAWEAAALINDVKGSLLGAKS